MWAIPALAGAGDPYVTSEWFYDEIGEVTSFYYRIQCLNTQYLLEAFHVFAPVDPDLLVVRRGWANGYYWNGVAIQYAPGIAQIVWAPSSFEGGLMYGDSVQVSIQVNQAIDVRSDYTLPDYTTNWGYETTNSAYVLAGEESVDVPVSVPEPAGIAALLTGCIGLLKRRR